jgi:hypothetical protein
MIFYLRLTPGWFAKADNQAGLLGCLRFVGGRVKKVMFRPREQAQERLIKRKKDSASQRVRHGRLVMTRECRLGKRAARTHATGFMCYFN